MEFIITAAVVLRYLTLTIFCCFLMVTVFSTVVDGFPFHYVNERAMCNEYRVKEICHALVFLESFYVICKSMPSPYYKVCYSMDNVTVLLLNYILILFVSFFK